MGLVVRLTRLRHRLRLRQRLGLRPRPAPPPPVGRSSASDHDAYTSLCARAATDASTFARFKSEPVYRDVLEHVTCDLGREYLDRVLAVSPELTALFDRFRENDRLGSPALCGYGEHGRFSPTTLRYVKVLSDLLLLFGSLDGLHVVEIGCGYGGQCFVIAAAARPASYTLVDLPDTLALQRRYLGELGVGGTRFVAPAELRQVGDVDLVLSNYAFSECRRSVQEEYLEQVLGRAPRGYVTCNFVSPPEFASLDRDELLERLPQARFRREQPLTATANAILVWGTGDGEERFFEALDTAAAL